MVLGSAIVSGDGVVSGLVFFFLLFLRRSSLVMVISEVSSSVLSGVVLDSLVVP